MSMAWGSREPEEAPSTWRADMTKAIGELNEKDTGLLITVDEVSAQSDELSVLIDSFQHFVRERRDVALLLGRAPAQRLNTHRCGRDLVSPQGVQALDGSDIRNRYLLRH